MILLFSVLNRWAGHAVVMVASRVSVKQQERQQQPRHQLSTQHVLVVKTLAIVIRSTVGQAEMVFLFAVLRETVEQQAMVHLFVAIIALPVVTLPVVTLPVVTPPVEIVGVAELELERVVRVMEPELVPVLVPVLELVVLPLLRQVQLLVALPILVHPLDPQVRRHQVDHYHMRIIFMLHS